MLNCPDRLLEKHAGGVEIMFQGIEDHVWIVECLGPWHVLTEPSKSTKQFHVADLFDSTLS